jgi:hypothetical protein
MSLLRIANGVYQKAELSFWRSFQKWIAAPGTKRVVHLGLQVLSRYQDMPIIVQGLFWLAFGFLVGIPLQWLIP